MTTLTYDQLIEAATANAADSSSSSATAATPS
jgi:hypothetical protein